MLSLESGEIDARSHDLEPAGTVPVDRTVGEANVDDYDGLILPGGTVNPDKLRHGPDQRCRSCATSSGRANRLPRSATDRGRWLKPTWFRDRTLTSYPSVRTDLRNAGATVVDQQVCVDGNLITSRSPDDLPAFCQAITDQFANTPAHT